MSAADLLGLFRDNASATWLAGNYIRGGGATEHRWTAGPSPDYTGAMNRAEVLILTACSHDEPDHADDLGSNGSSSVPDLSGGDLPSSLSDTDGATQDSTTDGATDSSTSDATTTSENTGTEDTGTTDTGSEAVPTSLEVHASGQRIGYLLGVWDYGFTIWDDEAEVTFQINQQTGHVVGAAGSPYYYTTANCSGNRYQPAPYVSVSECGDVPAPTRRFVRGDGGSQSGHVQAPAVVVGVGAATLVMAQSSMIGGNCQPGVVQFCGFPMQDTNAIPTTFPLPITVVETTAVP